MFIILKVPLVHVFEGNSKHIVHFVCVLSVCTHITVLQYSYTSWKTSETRPDTSSCFSVHLLQKKLKAEAKKAIGQLRVRTLRPGDQVHLCIPYVHVYVNLDPYVTCTFVLCLCDCIVCRCFGNFFFYFHVSVLKSRPLDTC